MHETAPPIAGKVTVQNYITAFTLIHELLDFKRQKGKLLLHTSITDLGAPMITAIPAVGERKFGQTYAIRILLAALLLVPAALLVWAAQDTSPKPDRTLLGIAIALAVGCVLLWIAIRRTELTINDFGVKRSSIFGTEELLWSQITDTRYFVNPINLTMHFGLMGAAIAAATKSKPVNLTLRVRSSDGKEIKITSNFRNAKEAIGLILTHVLPPMLADARSRLERGEKVQFGPVALSKTEVLWKSKAIPVSEVAAAEIAGPKLRVKRVGKWLDYISIRSDKIPNVLVFLELLESVAPQLKAAGIDPLAHVSF